MQLVLAMRGGPISTRRVVLEDPSLQEVIDYVEANGDDMWNDLPTSDSTQVTVLLFRLFSHCLLHFISQTSLPISHIRLVSVFNVNHAPQNDLLVQLRFSLSYGNLTFNVAPIMTRIVFVCQ